MKIDPTDLVGVSEIAQRTNVSSAAVSNWAARYENFPAPTVELNGGKFWLWTDIDSWLEATGRKAK